MKLLTIALLASSARAANMIFAPTPYPVCTECLDLAVSLCTGDYTTELYASCICDGQGGSAIASCLGTCNSADTLPMGIVGVLTSATYRYCVQFFPDVWCPSAQEPLGEEFATFCGNDASGSGTSGSGSDSGSESSSDVSEPNSTASPTSPADQSTESNGGASGAGRDPGTTTAPAAANRSSNAAVVGSMPAWGIMVGLGLAGMNV